MRSGLVVGVALSLLAHAGLVAAVGSLVSPRDPRPKELPLEILPAPVPPPPPKLPEPEKPPPPPPPEKPRKPRPPRVKKPPVPVVADAAPDEADAGVATDAGLIADAGADAGDGGEATDGGDAATDGATDAGLAADAGDAGTSADAGVPVPIDPAVVDLRPFLPNGERVMLVLRTDRLRGTPWASRLENLVAPMPDHRMVLDGTGLGLTDTFDVVVISSAEPRDVTRTFLAARSTLDEGALRRALARPGAGTPGPRLRWHGVEAERLDPRVARLADPRRLSMPSGGWFVLVRPEHLEEGRRAWLAALPRIDEQTGAGPTVAVVMLADLGTPTLQLPVPGMPALPAPDRLTVAVTVEKAGMVLTGAGFFPDAAAATTFVELLEKARGSALQSFAGKVLLRSFHAEGAVQRLAFVRDGAAVTFSTSLANDEADALLGQAAEMARQFFTPARIDPPK